MGEAGFVDRRGDLEKDRRVEVVERGSLCDESGFRLLSPGLQTQRWLTNHGLETPSVVVSSKKGEIARAIRATHSLEDKIENAWAIHWISDSPQTKSFLLDRPYNRVQESPEIGARGIIRVGSVEEFLDEVEGE